MAVALYTGLMVIVSIFVWFFAEKIVDIFNTDPELVKIASDFMRIQILGYLGFGLTVVLSLSIEGVGDTIPTMIGTIFSMWAIQIPLAYFLSKSSLGVNGIQWAITIALLARAAMFTVYYMTGRWKRKVI